MKSLLLFSCFSLHFFCVVAQNTTPSTAKAQNTTTKKYWDINNLFVGGSLGLGFGSGTYASSLLLGANPQVGYSFSNFFDGGLIFNVNFNNAKFTEYGVRYRQNSFNYGAGLLFRFNILPSLFIQAQPELNWINYSIKNLTYPDMSIYKETVSATSFLAGIGYGQRMRGQSGFYTIVMIDFVNNKNSPYRNAVGDIIPIIRAGYTFYLGQKKRKAASENQRNGTPYKP